MAGRSTVLFILHMPPPVHGAAMVGKFIHDSERINSEFNCHYINLATAIGMEDIGKFKVKKVFSFWHLLRQIRQVVKDTKPDLVYITPNAKGGPFYKDFVVVMMLKRMGCKVIAHYHNKGVSSRQERMLDNLLYQRFFKGINVILLSERLFSDVQKYVKREDVYICPNGIPQKNEKSKLKRGETVRIPHLLFLSNLLIEKGVLVLLDAMRILKDKGYSCVCDVVGGETAEIDANVFEREVRTRGIQDFVLYHGKRYGTEKEAYLKDADIFVFPTFYQNECFPLVLLEAMQYSLAIITTNEGGIADIVQEGENGLFCEKNNPEDLARVMMRLLDNQSLCMSIGQNGYQTYLHHYTLDAFVKRLSGILQSIE